MTLPSVIELVGYRITTSYSFILRLLVTRSTCRRLIPVRLCVMYESSSPSPLLPALPEPRLPSQQGDRYIRAAPIQTEPLIRVMSSLFILPRSPPDFLTVCYPLSGLNAPPPGLVPYRISLPQSFRCFRNAGVFDQYWMPQFSKFHSSLYSLAS